MISLLDFWDYYLEYTRTFVAKILPAEVYFLGVTY